ncbi:MAG: hypothetical protein HY426_00105 [Candidatus Levybacteria bacterium]|nr:hypothetical protein [Candidatus Levybacteria bacterium]
MTTEQDHPSPITLGEIERPYIEILRLKREGEPIVVNNELIVAFRSGLHAARKSMTSIVLAVDSRVHVAIGSDAADKLYEPYRNDRITQYVVKTVDIHNLALTQTAYIGSRYCLSYGGIDRWTSPIPELVLQLESRVPIEDLSRIDKGSDITAELFVRLLGKQQLAALQAHPQPR